jgi:hypothetical protein
MPETKAELAREVNEALSWLGAPPEEAGPLLGINATTLDAMSRGIVPMRSLVIRFAAGLAARCQEREGAPERWQDADAWLRLAGYDAARTMPHHEPRTRWERAPLPDESLAPPPRRDPAMGPEAAGTGERVAPAPPAPAPAASTGEEGGAAKDHYHPAYERVVTGDGWVHVFWIADEQGRKLYRINVAPHADYKAKAAQVKQDLATLSRAEFERRYGRFRNR